MFNLKIILLISLNHFNKLLPIVNNNKMQLTRNTYYLLNKTINMKITDTNHENNQKKLLLCGITFTIFALITEATCKALKANNTNPAKVHTTFLLMIIANLAFIISAFIKYGK